MTATLRTLIGVLCVAMSTLGPTPVMAQSDPSRSSEGREHLERRVWSRFGEMVQAELDIDRATSTRLGETMASFLPERRRLGMRDKELRDRIREVDTVLPAAEAQAMLDELVEVLEDKAALFAREQAELLEFLAPGQLLRFYALRDQFEERVRRVRDQSGGAGDAPSGSRRGGGGGRP